VDINLDLAYPVLEVKDKDFGLIKDEKNEKSRCEFVLFFQRQASETMGYAIQ
jgi:hypothetical protein